MRKNKGKDTAILLIPAVAVIFITVIFPLLYSFVISFTDTNLRRQGIGSFTGLNNYIEILKDPYFIGSVWTTVKFTAISVLIEFTVGFVIAGLLNRVNRFREFFFSIIIVPMMISCVAVGLVWRLLLHANLGIVNYVLDVLGIGGRAWLGDASYALGALIFVDVWQEVPYMALLLLAGMVSLPRDPFEAARIEGAKAWQVLRYVTIPIMKPTIIVALLLRTINALKTYDLVYVMTKGGPGTSTEVIGYHIYKQAYAYLDTGKASAMSYLLLISILLISVILARISRERD